MDIRRNQTVKVIAGSYKGERGRVIQQPFGKDGITTVIRDNGRAFAVKAAELVVIGDMEEVKP